MRFFDTHCHVQFQAFAEDREAVIKKNLEKGVMMNLVGTHRDTSAAAVSLAEQHEGVYATIGTHPVHLFPTHIDEEESHFLSREEYFDEAYFEKLAASPKVIGVGETGLDAFHLPPDVSKEVVLEKQKNIFLKHVAFAKKHDLALVIHCREAHDELIGLLRSESMRAVVHCYTSGWRHAEKYLDIGFYLGFTGVITFPPKKIHPQEQLDLLDVVKRMPLDRIVVETDAPYLASQAYRGQRAEPWMAEEQIKKIAEVKGLTFEEVREATTHNALKLFQMK